MDSTNGSGIPDGVTYTVDSIWECPCGWTGTMHDLSHHRRRKDHPRYDKSDPSKKSKFISNGTGPPMAALFKKGQSGRTVKKKDAASDELDSRETGGVVPKPTREEPESGRFNPRSVLSDDAPDSFSLLSESDDDPESVAERLLRSSIGQSTFFDGSAQHPGGYGAVPPGGGFTLGGDGSEWTPESPGVAASPASDRITITVPVMIHLYHQWALSEGWMQSDGSLEAFVNDCLLDHLQDCWNLGIFVARRSDLLPEPSPEPEPELDDAA